MIGLFPITLTILTLTTSLYYPNIPLVLTLAFCSVLSWIAYFQYKKIRITGARARPGLVRRVHFTPNEVDRMIQEESRRVSERTGKESRRDLLNSALIETALVSDPLSYPSTTPTAIATASTLAVYRPERCRLSTIDPSSPAEIRPWKRPFNPTNLNLTPKEQMEGKPLDKLNHDPTPTRLLPALMDPIMERSLIPLHPSPTPQTQPPGKQGLLKITPPPPFLPLETNIHFSTADIARRIQDIEFVSPSLLTQRRRHRRGKRSLLSPMSEGFELSASPPADEEVMGRSIPVSDRSAPVKAVGKGKKGELTITIPVLSLEEQKEYGTYWPGEIEVLQEELEGVIAMHNNGTGDMSVSADAGGEKEILEMEDVGDGEDVACEPDNFYLVPPGGVVVEEGEWWERV
jgi:hypothetical protein